MTMIDFIFKFKELSLSWQSRKSQTYSLIQISQMTQTSLPYVIKHISDSLGVELEYTQLINFQEARAILDSMSKKHKTEIDIRLKKVNLKAQKLQEAYKLLLKKTSKQQMEKNWGGAFKTLSYFAGEHGNELPRALFVNLCSNIVHTGIKTEQISLQEISWWLKKAINANTQEHSKETFCDSLDLIETYSDFFLQNPSQKGASVLLEILSSLEEPASELDLWEDYKSSFESLFLKDSIEKSSKNAIRSEHPTLP